YDQSWCTSIGCVFFSSRRRHTRFSRDWSSDVCSSDLKEEFRLALKERLRNHNLNILLDYRLAPSVAQYSNTFFSFQRALTKGFQIGRASCRERVWSSGGRDGVQKKVKRVRLDSRQEEL